jgi:hypothetical protein
MTTIHTRQIQLTKMHIRKTAPNVTANNDFKLRINFFIYSCRNWKLLVRFSALEWLQISHKHVLTCYKFWSWFSWIWLKVLQFIATVTVFCARGAQIPSPTSPLRVTCVRWCLMFADCQNGTCRMSPFWRTAF